MHNIEYKQRLKLLGVTTLQKRRIRGDMIEVFKILTDREGVARGDFFELSKTSYDLRGHKMKLVKNRSRLDLRKHFFS